MRHATLGQRLTYGVLACWSAEVHGISSTFTMLFRGDGYESDNITLTNRPALTRGLLSEHEVCDPERALFKARRNTCPIVISGSNCALDEQFSNVVVTI